jgi:hypothetical protein
VILRYYFTTKSGFYTQCPSVLRGGELLCGVTPQIGLNFKSLNNLASRYVGTFLKA